MDTTEDQDTATYGGTTHTDVEEPGAEQPGAAVLDQAWRPPVYNLVPMAGAVLLAVVCLAVVQALCGLGSAPVDGQHTGPSPAAVVARRAQLAADVSGHRVTAADVTRAVGAVAPGAVVTPGPGWVQLEVDGRASCVALTGGHATAAPGPC